MGMGFAGLFLPFIRCQLSVVVNFSFSYNILLLSSLGFMTAQYANSGVQFYIYRTRPRATRKCPLGKKVNKVTGGFAAITLKHKDFTREYLPRPPVVIICVQLR